MADEGNGTTIRYTTKELLHEMDKKLDVIDQKIDGKADKSVVDQMVRGVEEKLLEQKLELRRVAGLVDVNLPRFEEVRHDLKTTKATVGLHNEWMRSQDAIRESSRQAFSRSEKIIGTVFAAIIIVLNILALGPDIYH